MDDPKMKPRFLPCGIEQNGVGGSRQIIQTSVQWDQERMDKSGKL